ncbi:MAG TPA: signal peptide peptidase SppA, partial [Azospirillaceae bacterium]|nr:signal peptide peptidase SppA [Azospirillaceae bacterium]
MFRFIFRFFAAVGLLVAAGIAALVWFIVSHEAPIPERIVLSLDLSQPLPETSAGGLEDAFDRRLTLADALDALERAETDPKVKGVVARFGGDAFGYAKA